MDLLLASNNAGKVREVRAALAGLDFAVHPVRDFLPDFDPVEDGDSFLANARIKAEAAFHATGRPVVADDSGLCVVGLGLEPGIHSARYGGEGKSDSDRVEHLLAQMETLRGEDRRAWFACVLYAILQRESVAPVEGVLQVEPAYPGGFVALAIEGRLNGHIGVQPRGERGFGYDPVFHPDADPGRTLAEFALAEKNRISHRGQALARLREALNG